MMKQSTIIKLVDFLSFMTLTLMLSTGVFLRFTLPPRSGSDTLFGLSRHEWGDVHYYFSLVFLFFMSVHLIMHVKFIKAVLLGKASAEKNYRIALGVVGLVALITLAFAPLVSPVTENQRGQQYHRYNR